MIKCTKRKLTWLEAEMMVERNKGVGHSRKYSGRRKESRYYFCDKCRAYHVTSSDWHYTDKDYANLRSKDGNGKVDNSSSSKKS